jgi:hypothetical protein
MQGTQASRAYSRCRGPEGTSRVVDWNPGIKKWCQQLLVTKIWERRMRYGVGEKVMAPGGRPKPDILIITEEVVDETAAVCISRAVNR